MACFNSRFCNHFRPKTLLARLKVSLLYKAAPGKCQLLNFHLGFDYGKILEQPFCFSELRKTTARLNHFNSVDSYTERHLSEVEGSADMHLRD